MTAIGARTPAEIVYDRLRDGSAYFQLDPAQPPSPSAEPVLPAPLGTIDGCLVVGRYSDEAPFEL